MKRYFKITKISKAEFTKATGEILNCDSVVCPAEGNVYAAVDDNALYDLEIPIDALMEAR